MWTGSVTGSHTDNRHGVAGQADLVRLSLLQQPEGNGRFRASFMGFPQGVYQRG
jgi:hypothetical protein